MAGNNPVSSPSLKVNTVKSASKYRIIHKDGWFRLIVSGGLICSVVYKGNATGIALVSEAMKQKEKKKNTTIKFVILIGYVRANTE